MKGYVACKGTRWYAVICEGIDPVTGRERRSRHPAGTERADAERLAAPFRLLELRRAGPILRFRAASVHQSADGQT
jgi:hypothetical protein